MVSSLYLVQQGHSLHIDSCIISISFLLSLFTHANNLGTLAVTDEGNGMIGRDDVQYSNETQDSANAYAETWQVNEMIDGKLFFNSSTQACIAPPTPNLNTSEAEAACIGVRDEPEDLYKNCLFDVALTGDRKWATTPIYTDYPLDDVLEDQENKQCIDNECANQGGSCIFRCNKEFFDCAPDLCQASGTPSALFPPPDGYVEGCSCAFEITFCVDHWFLTILQFLFGLLLWLFGMEFCRW